MVKSLLLRITYDLNAKCLPLAVSILGPKLELLFQELVNSLVGKG